MSKNAVVNIPSHHPPSALIDQTRTAWLIANSFEMAEKIAALMAKMGTMPVHLRDKPADCFRIVVQASKWGMDPYAVAECTSLVHGRLCYEGKLVAAVLEQMDVLEGGHLDWEITGKGQDSAIIMRGTRRGETKVLECKGSVSSWRTHTFDRDTKKEIKNNWDNNPHDQLVYKGTRQWARLHASGAMMGIYTADEIEAEGPVDVTASARVVATDLVTEARERAIPIIENTAKVHEQVPPASTAPATPGAGAPQGVAMPVVTTPAETGPTAQTVVSRLTAIRDRFPQTGIIEIRKFTEKFGVKYAKDIPIARVPEALALCDVMERVLHEAPADTTNQKADPRE